MSLFHIPVPKHMKLEEFEQTQSQATSQVQFAGPMSVTIVHVRIKIDCTLLVIMNIIIIINAGTSIALKS